jgi:NADPH-dependent ferric siderophore reductase
MIESMPQDNRAIGLFEIDSPSDEQAPTGDFGSRLEVHWTYRAGQSQPGDAGPMLGALAAIDLPLDSVHTYVLAEARVTRDIHKALNARGFSDDQISAKAYWRRGLPNAEHGEPTRED